MPRNNNIQFRKGTSTAWTDANPILASGEPGFEINSNRLKIGIGSNWNDTSYISADSLITTVYNSSGATISGFNVVYISGGHGNLPAIARSIATTDQTSARTYGVTINDIPNHASGLVITNGLLKNLNTNAKFGTNKEGSSLWLSPTVSGDITLTKPYAPDHAVFIGTIIRSHNTQGSVEVKIQNGYELEELHDVAVTGVTNGQFLQYNSASGLWLASSSGNFSSLTINNTKIATGTGIANHVAYWNSTSGIVADSGQLYWDSTNNRLGISTTSPESNLHIVGDVTFGNNPKYGGDGFYFSNSSLSVIENNFLNTKIDSNSLSIYGNDEGGAGTLQFFSVDRTNGRVGIGIGNTTPAVTLDVLGDGRFSTDLTVGGNLTVNGSVVTANVDRMEIEDPIITLGLASGNIVTTDTLDRGLALVRGTGLTAFMGWDTSASQFVMLSSGVASNSSGNYDAGTYGNLQINNLNASSGNFSSNLTVNNTGVSLSGHSHSVSNITDFNSGVSGLLPTIANSGDNRILTSTGSTVGINAESNLAFNGNLLNVTGSGSFSSTVTSSGFVRNAVGVSTNDVLLAGGTSSPQSALFVGSASVANAATHLNGGLSGSIPYQSNTSATTFVSIGSNGQFLTSNGSAPVWTSNPVTGTGVANHIAYWNSSSGIVADSGQLYWDSTNNRLGIGTATPNGQLHVVGDAIYLNMNNGQSTIYIGDNNLGIIKNPAGSANNSYVPELNISNPSIYNNYNTNVFFCDTSNNIGIRTRADTGYEDVYCRLLFNVSPAYSNYNGFSTTLTTNSSVTGDITVTLPSSNGTLARLSDITTSQITGVLSVAKGGTNMSTYSNGQLLIGSGTSLAANTLTAGTGISITNGSGTITINSNIANPVTGTGVANHIAYWNSSSGIIADSGQLYWDSTNDRLGIGTTTPSGHLDVAGDVYIRGTGNNLGTAYFKSQAIGDKSLYLGATNGGDLVMNGGGASIQLSSQGGYLNALGMSTQIHIGHGYDGGNTTQIIRFLPAAKEMMRMTTSGTLGIGLPTSASSYAGNTVQLFNQQPYPNTRVHIAGSGATSSSAALIVTNSGISPLLYVRNDGNIGIGTTTPSYTLQVNGNFGATTKSFRIDHPSKKGYSLEYGSLESPYHGVRLTGRSKVAKGIGTVDLPDYLKDLIYDDASITIQLTNYKHGKTLYVDEIDLQNDKFIVKADRAKSLGELEFFWTLTGVRKDVDHLVVEKENL